MLIRYLVDLKDKKKYLLLLENTLVIFILVGRFSDRMALFDVVRGIS